MQYIELPNLIYIIFPIILFLSCLFKNTKGKAILLGFLFIVLFVCAETGADYDGYKKIYNNSLTDDNLHGELLYLLLCKIGNLIGLSYNGFRIIFLSLFLILMLYSIYKMSDNFSLSFLLAYFMYIVYFVSAYRQFATMSILFFSLYIYFYKHKKATALLLNIIAIFIHKMAIFQTLVIIGLIVKDLVKKRKNFKINQYKVPQLLFLGIAFSLILRCCLYLICKQSFMLNFLAKFYYLSGDLSLINNGVLSRLLILVLICVLFEFNDVDSKTKTMFMCYAISLIIYFALPFELVMGRLINNVKMLEIILIPNFIIQKKNCDNLIFNKKRYIINDILIIVIFLLSVIIFANQMLVQSGYSDYTNILWSVI